MCVRSGRPYLRRPIANESDDAPSNKLKFTECNYSDNFQRGNYYRGRGSRGHNSSFGGVYRGTRGV